MRIGRYETEKELGRGAMGVVFAARDPEGRPVAIKLLLPGNAKRERRFAREVEALVRLRHDNVVRLLDAGEHQSFPYLVTELIDGETLEDKLAREGPLDPAAAARVARDLGRGLAHAHENDVLHRDVKPSNVLIEPDGRARLVDFGLTRDLSEAGSLTQSGQLLGTPGFWAPEQARGLRHVVGPLTDVYGLGATLYAALTGDPPAQGGTIGEVLVATCDRPTPPPSRARPGLDPALDALCLRCLEKDPQRRFPSAQAVADALDAWLARRGTEGPAPRARRVPALIAAAGAVVLAAGALALSRGAGEGADPTTERAPVVDTAPPPPPGPTPEQVRAAAALARGRELFKARDLRGALAAYDEALLLEPTNVAALLARARAHGADQDLKKAEQDALRAVELAPTDPDAWATLGDMRSDDRSGKALADYEKAIALDPHHPGGLHGRGLLRHAQGRLEDALADLRRVIDEGRADAMTFVYRASVYEDLAERGMNTRENLKLALADLDEALRREETPHALFDRARLLRNRGEHDKALRDLDRSLALEEDANTYYSRAQVKRDLADLRGAEADLERAAALEPRDGLFWFELGKARVDLRDLAGAEEAYTRAIQAAPEEGAGWIERGKLRLARGDAENGKRDLDEAVKRQPDSSRVRYERGLARLASNDPRGAVEDFEWLAQEEPEDPWAPYQKGLALLAAGDAPAAEAEFERSLQRDPSFPWALLERGKLRKARGDDAGALADWRRADRGMPPADKGRVELDDLLRAAGRGR